MTPRATVMLNLLLCVTGIWLMLLLAAILNAMVREQLFAAWFGQAVALPLSGITLSVLVFAIALVFVPRLGTLSAKLYLGIGLVWVVLTLAFEFLLGYFLLAQAWRETIQVLDITQGNLFALVLVVSLLSPWLAARLRGLL